MPEKRTKKSTSGLEAEVKAFLTENAINFAYSEQSRMFDFDILLDGTIKHLHYTVRLGDDDCYMIVHTSSPIGPDTDDHEVLARMAEFLCRANYGLKDGNFEMDMTDGEIRYKIYIDCSDERIPCHSAVLRSIYRAVLMYKKYDQGIIDILFTQASAAEAVARCEDTENQVGSTDEEFQGTVKALTNETDDDAAEDVFAGSEQTQFLIDLFENTETSIFT